MSKTTLAKRVLSQADIDDSIDVAFWGHVLSPIERAALSYTTKQGQTTKEQFLGMILDAVEKRDGNALRGVASILDAFHGFPNQPDMLRVRLLWTNKELDSKGESIPIRALAELLKIEDSSGDGFKTLRRLCAELKVPIRQVARGRKGIKANKTK